MESKTTLSNPKLSRIKTKTTSEIKDAFERSDCNAVSNRSKMPLLYLLFFSILLALPISNLHAQTQTFTTTGTFTVPSNVSIVTVEAWGGGGRGANRTSNGTGGGGGGGAYARKAVTVTPGGSYTVTIGAGSATNGVAGSDSWFGTAATILAKGGSSGPVNTSTPGAGGLASASIGDVVYSGGAGSSSGGGGSSAGTASVGASASDILGATAPSGGGSGGLGGTVAINGSNGSAPGGGGGGGYKYIFGTQTPGSGGNGKITITWVLPTITAFNPTSICALGNRTVVLTGTLFTGATAVKFNGVNAESFTINSATSITAVAPLGVVTGNVTVTVPNGTGTSTPIFIVKQNPTVATITGPTSVCLPDSNTITLSDTTPTGVWSSSNVDIATVTASGIVRPVVAGNVVISYTVTDNGCSTTKTFTVAVNNLVNILSATATQTVVTGGNTFFTANASGSPTVGQSQLIYQWQITTDGETFTPLSNNAVYGGTNTATLSLTGVPAELNESLYRVVVSGACGSVSSDLAVLLVGDTGIETQPSNISICDAGTGSASFSIIASSDATAYQWQEDQGGDNWTDIVNGGIYAGANTPTLSLTGLTLANSGWKYRCFVAGISSATSNPAVLTVIPSAIIDNNPISQTICYTGGNAVFSVGASGGVGSYQWQYSPDNGTNWGNIANGTPSGTTYTGVNTNTLSLAAGSSIPASTHLYRAVVGSLSPCTALIPSSSAQLIINTPVVSVQPASTTVGAGNTATFTVATSGTSPTYQWQYAATAGGTYSNVVNGTPTGITYSGATSATLSATVASSVAAGNARFYRAIVSSPVGCSINSNSAQLTTTTYCTPSVVLGGSGDIITNVVISNPAEGTSITQASSGASPWFTFYNNTPVNITQGQIASVAITFGSDDTQYSAIWVDYNRNGTFESTENVALATAANGANTTRTYTFTIPFTASPGTARVRISGGNDSAYAAGTPCPSTLYGETEDYMINILAAPACAGTPVAGTIVSSTSNICLSGTATLTASGYSTGLTGLSIQWYDTATGAISGATGPTYTTPALTSASSYFLRVTCSNSGAFSNSNTVTINYTNPAVTSVTPASRCGAGTITLAATGSAGATLQWYAASTGGTSLFTGSNYILSNLSATTTFYVAANIGSCTSASRTAVTATINQGPTLSLSSVTNAVCAGNSTPTVTISAGLSSYDTFVWTPAAGVSGSAASGYIFNPAATTTYTLNASSASSGCTNSVSYTAVVNPLPSGFAVSPTSALSCSSDNPVVLTASGGSIGNVTIMNENFSNNAPAWTITNTGVSASAWAYIAAPYTDTADTATFANFSTTNGGKFAMANADGSAFSNTNTMLTSPAFSTVGYSAATLNFEQVYQSLADTTVKLEISSNGGSSWTQLVSYGGTSVGTTTNNAQATATATVSLNAYLNQPNLKIRYNYVSVLGYYWIVDNVRVTGTDPGKVTWSPQTGLYTNAAGTIPYAGAAAATVYAKPTSNTTYTAIIAALTGCSVSTQATITTAIAANYYVDSDGDTYGAGAPLLTCAPPSGYVTNNTDCNDANANVYRNGTFYVDADNDGYNNGAGAVSVCYGAALPSGYTPNNIGVDCDDTSADVYRNGTFYVDADGDGYNNGANAVTVCYGAALPTGYTPNNIGVDCNDANANVYRNGTFYVDADGDGYNNGNGAVTLCYGAALPSGYTPNNIGVDCNDAIAAINPGHVEVLYNGVDDNCDGQLDEGFVLKTKLLPEVCGSTMASINSLIGITTLNVTGITGYRIKVVNGASVQILEKNVPHFSFQELPNYDYAATYSISIELQKNGIWLGYYGDVCLVSSPAVLASGGAAQVSPSQCGITLPRINTLIATTSLAGATGYRFRVTNITSGATGPNIVQVIDRNLHWMSLTMLAQYNYGATYRVEIAVKTTGAYSGFGSPCEVSSPAAPSLINCGGSIATPATLVAATSISDVTQYRFQITRMSDNATTTIDRTTNYFTFNMVPGFTAGAQYAVRVAVMTVGTWSTFGDACQITAPGAARSAPETVTNYSVAFNVVAYPNPFASMFELKIFTSDMENIEVKIYDMTGKLIDKRNVGLSEVNDKLSFGTNLPSGVYNVILLQGSQTMSVRVIKR